MSELERDVAALCAGFSGRVALALHRYDDGSRLLRDATEPLPAASLIKLPILACTLAETARGRLKLGQRVPLERGHRVGGSGVLKTLQPGLSPTVRDLLTLMIVVSDNTATNMLIDLVGAREINAFLHVHGLRGSSLVGKLQLPEGEQSEAQRRGARNRTCAADILGLLLQLERGEVLPPQETRLALEILEAQQFTEAMSRYLPRDPDLDPEALVVASKSGCLRGVWHDAGLVFDRERRPRWALVVMTTESHDRSFGYEQEGMLLIARIARRVHEAVVAG